MISKIASVKTFRTICFFLNILIVYGCYSNFALDENKIDDAIKNKEISKIKLKNESVINFYNNENVLVSIDSESVTYQDNKGDTHKTAINDIVQLYEYQLDYMKILFTAFWLSISVLYLIMNGHTLGG